MLIGTSSMNRNEPNRGNNYIYILYTNQLYTNQSYKAHLIIGMINIGIIRVYSISKGVIYYI